MAGTINYLYDPNQNIYVISECDEKRNPPYVTGGIVMRIRSEVLVSETTIVYDIRLDGYGGTQEFAEADVFLDKATAVAEYSNRVE